MKGLWQNEIAAAQPAQRKLGNQLFSEWNLTSFCTLLF